MNLTPEDIQESIKETGGLSLFPSTSFLPLIRFIEKMLDINRSLNLTKWVKNTDVLKYHVKDSAICLLSLSNLLKNQDSPQAWLDLGTGCGFPGILLLAAYPHWNITFLDSIGKKVKAVQECLDVSEWKAKTLIGRAEEIGQNLNYRESFDGVVTRAVAEFGIVLEYAIPLLKVGGYLVDWRTQEQLKVVEKSKNALDQLHSKIIKIDLYTLPNTTQKRCLVIVEKLGKTLPQYPRSIGKPFKNSL